ncbi:hypothetical protein [Streptococcus thoraltensis]|uniref:hypothetical protein n=1 Tax=Streptococcus thoraltensis TaxID=55085 RepID=UPI000372104E|nr:hypothetical protein [Streptococcus thoraltensis]MDY4761354.1 hypothetical protein [Streptococcus thoraltensis]
MIDYYKGINVRTGEAVSYLAELRGKIRQEDSAKQIYQVLIALGEELDNRETLGDFNADSRALSQALPQIKRHFLSEKWKTAYDYQLVQHYLKQSDGDGEDEDVYPLPIEEVEIRQEIVSPISQTTLSQEVSSPWWQKWFLQVVIVLVVLAMTAFLDLDTSLALIILLVVLIVSLFLSN